MTARRQDAGRRGEELAARYLEADGYRVVGRNYRCRLGEIDLVAERDQELVFVEVRTKRQPCMVYPEETVTWAKAARLVRLAQHYLVETGQEERPWRVDLIAVELGERDRPVRMERFENATSGVVSS